MSNSNTPDTALSNDRESMHYLRLGDQDVWTLSDAFFVQEAGLFALEATEQEIVELLTSYDLAPNELRVSACPILLNRDGNRILADPSSTAEPAGKQEYSFSMLSFRPR